MLPILITVEARQRKNRHKRCWKRREEKSREIEREDKNREIEREVVAKRLDKRRQRVRTELGV